MTKKTIVYGSFVVILVSLVAIAYYGVLYTSSEPSIDFDYEQVAQVGDRVTFSNTSSINDPALEWNWDFGDQSEIMNSLSAKHAFPAPGRFVVTLSVTVDDNTLMKQKIIQVTQPQLTAAFDIEASSVAAGDSLIISNNSQNATDFVWFLGDGRTLQGENPVVSYPKSGEYELSLVAINSIGQSDQYSLNVSIQSGGAPKPDQVTNEVIVKHIAIFDERSLSEAFTQLANSKIARSGKRKIRNDVLRDVASINILVNDLSLENFMNKIQLEASKTEVTISVTEVKRDSNNKISSITIN